MLSRISTHLSETRAWHLADWTVLAIGAVMLTTAIAGTVLSPAVSIQAESDLAEAREEAAL